MKYECVAFALLLIAAPALAANKTLLTGQDGPAGCGWRAAVVDTHPGAEFTVDLVLEQMVGKCMYDPGPCGAKDDHFTAPIRKDDIQSYHIGQITKVWVTDGKVSFDLPQCVRTPG